MQDVDTMTADECGAELMRFTSMLEVNMEHHGWRVFLCPPPPNYGSPKMLEGRAPTTITLALRAALRDLRDMLAAQEQGR